MWVITRNRGANINLRTQLQRIITMKHGVEPWPKLFQNLRRSCEKEWAMEYPQYAVSKWIGHSISVSGKHSANAVPDELFDRAARISVSGEAVQNVGQQVHEVVRNAPYSPNSMKPQNAKNPNNCRGFQRFASECKQKNKWSRRDSNPRAVTVGESLLRA